MQLPIYQHKQSLLDRIVRGREQAYLVCGETGSGKTTQLPQYIYEDMKQLGQTGMVGVTQPRRVAAITVSQRVAQEQGVVLGQEVGYSVRFDQKYNAQNTRIKFMTDGMLLRECILDPMLKSYSYLLVDEAHERTMHSDILLALIKNLLNRRKDLKLVVMSATIEIDKFARYLGLKQENILSIEGRCHPIELYYTQQPQSDYVDTTLHTVLQIHMDHLTEKGDILAFLTGQEDIEDVAQMLKDRISRVVFCKEEHILEVVPLYSALPNEQQMLAFQPTRPGHRKVILTTNIAETSVTVPGVRFVVDSGLAKVRQYHASKGIETLLALPISRSQAEQRAGRAGRVQAGKCFRLYTKESHDTAMRLHQKPELLRLNLNHLYLQLYAIKAAQHHLDIQHFPFLDAPQDNNVKQSVLYLLALKALSDPAQEITDFSAQCLSQIPLNRFCLTPLGREIAQLPLDPHLGAMLLLGVDRQVASQMLSLVALMSVESIYLRRDQAQGNHYKTIKPFLTANSDHLTSLHIFSHYHLAQNKKSFAREQWLSLKTLKKVVQIRAQLVDYLKDILIRRGDSVPSLDISSEVEVGGSLECLARCLNQNTARLNQDGSYTLKVDGSLYGSTPSRLPTCTQTACVST